MKKEVCIKEKMLEKCQYCDKPYERDTVPTMTAKKLKAQREEGPVLISGENVNLQLFDFTQKGFVVTHMAATSSYVYLLMEKPKQSHDTHVILPPQDCETDDLRPKDYLPL